MDQYSSTPLSRRSAAATSVGYRAENDFISAYNCSFVLLGRWKVV